MREETEKVYTAVLDAFNSLCEIPGRYPTKIISQSTFNSLCEIRNSERIYRVRGVWKLSILFVRFPHVLRWLLQRSQHTFNSLCEIPQRIREAEAHLKVAFNSLCEIPRKRIIVSYWKDITFNSLCEIPRLIRWGRNITPALSILFVRFQEPHQASHHM